jgi:hypothetical protein
MPNSSKEAARWLSPGWLDANVDGYIWEEDADDD